MGTPNLSIGQDGFFHDPGMPLDIPRVDPHQVMRPNPDGSVDGIEYILEVRTFNKYNYDPVSLNTTEDVMTGATRAASADGKCWTECAYTTKRWHQGRVLVQQWYEVWVVNMTLTRYFEVVGHPIGGIVSGVVGTAGASLAPGTTVGGTIAGGVVGTVAQGALGATIRGIGTAVARQIGTAITGALGSAWVAGPALIVGGFMLGTAIAQATTKTAEKVGEGWMLVEPLPDWNKKELVGESTLLWKRCGEVHDCPPLRTSSTRVRVIVGAVAAAVLLVIAVLVLNGFGRVPLPGQGAVSSAASAATTPGAASAAPTRGPASPSAATAAGCTGSDHAAALDFNGVPLGCTHAGQYACMPTNSAYFYVDQEFAWDGADWQLGVTLPPFTGTTTQPAQQPGGSGGVALYDGATQGLFQATGGTVTATADATGMVVFHDVIVPTTTSWGTVKINGSMRCTGG